MLDEIAAERLTRFARHGVGYDYIHNDADGGNMRLDVRSQVK
jgi:hypothetical protein